MNIYEGDEIDLDAAVRELKATGPMTSEGSRKKAVAEISAAALLDIAASLRVIAAEAALAMSGEPAPGEEREADDEIDNPEESIGIGDFVIGEDWETPGRVIAIGESEGASWVEVAYEGESSTDRAWLDSVWLAPTIGEEAEAAGELDARSVFDEAQAAADADEREAAPLAETIDDDFETETVSALDLLRAAESKGSKKKGSKK